MNTIKAAILYDGSYFKSECCYCGKMTNKRYRAFPRTGGSFGFSACNQECADAAYVSFGVNEVTERAMRDRQNFAQGIV